MTETTQGVPLGAWLAELDDERLIRLLELRPDLTQPPPGTIAALAARAQGPPPFNTVTHLLYNPESNTQYSIVPGLLAVVLTMTMVLMTCLAITRERDQLTD